MDPLNPNKFRKNGGGILVAVKSSLLLTTNKVNLKCNAEVLAIELVLENKNKIIIATCYRVGTLGIDNCREVAKAINTLLRKKRVKKFFLIGDFNLSYAPSHLIHMSYSHLHISDHVIPSSHYTSSHFSLYHTHTTIITHLLSHLILLNTTCISTHPPSYKYHDHLTFTS